MILAVAGTQLPFPRLMGALDAIAARHGLAIVAQTAEPDGRYPALNTEAFMPPDVFDRHFAAASMIVAHAGIGTIIAAAERRKPLILMPRQVALGEHRSDHQLATVARFRTVPGIVVVDDAAALEAALLRDRPPAIANAETEARRQLVAAVATAVR